MGKYPLFEEYREVYQMTDEEYKAKIDPEWTPEEEEKELQELQAYWDKKQANPDWLSGKDWDTGEHYMTLTHRELLELSYLTQKELERALNNECAEEPEFRDDYGLLEEALLQE